MKLEKVAEALGLEFLVQARPEAEVRDGYVSDLLADVLAHAEPGSFGSPISGTSTWWSWLNGGN